LNLLILTADGDDTGYCIVGHIGFNYDRGIRYPMGEDWGGGEGNLEVVECGAAIISENPRNTLAGKPGQQDHNFGVFVDEMPVEVSEAEEGLNILDLTGSGQS